MGLPNSLTYVARRSPAGFPVCKIGQTWPLPRVRMVVTGLRFRARRTRRPLQVTDTLPDENGTPDFQLGEYVHVTGTIAQAGKYGIVVGFVKSAEMLYAV